jgi:hypothetical protein
MSMQLNDTEKDIKTSSSSAAESDPFDEIENERGKVNLEETEFVENEDEENKDQPPKKEKNTAKEEEIEEDDPEVKKSSKKVIQNEKSEELKNLEIELEKKSKALLDTQKWGRKNSQNIKKAMKEVQSLVDDGSLTEEESKKIMNAFDSPHENDEPIEQDEYLIDHTFAPVVKVARKELERVRDYIEDETLDDKLYAFEHSVEISSPQEQEEILHKLTKLINSPSKLLKEIIAIGGEAYNESFKEIKESGSLKEFINKKNNLISKLEKEIDKLKNKVQKSRDYTDSHYAIDELADPKSGNDDDSDIDPFDQAKQEKETSYSRRR